MNKLILVALLALSVVLLAKADWDDYERDDDGGYDDRLDNDRDDAEVSLRSKRDDDDDGYDDKVARLDNDRDDADVIIRSKRDDGDDWYDDKMNRLDNDRDDAEVIIRSKRALRGTYRENSKKNTHSYRQVLKHRTSTDHEGKVSTDTQHHHERNGAREESNKAGSFRFSNKGDNGWFDNSDHGRLIHDD